MNGDSLSRCACVRSIFRCIDMIEFKIAQALDFYLGFEEHPIPSSQPQHQGHKAFKETTFERFSAMRSKKLVEEAQRLQRDLVHLRLAENCIVMNKLSINPADVDHNFSPNIKQYTVMIGGCL